MRLVNCASDLLHRDGRDVSNLPAGIRISSPLHGSRSAFRSTGSWVVLDTKGLKTQLAVGHGQQGVSSRPVRGRSAPGDI